MQFNRSYDYARGQEGTRVMRVGIYFDLRNPPAWRVPPSRLYGFTLEMCREAELLGCDSVWLTEHHLFDDDYLPQPLTFAAAVAARTQRVRIGTGILIAPLHHPAEVAEQAAVVNILSDGRLDLGIGAGYRVPEFKLFGAEMATRYRATDDMARKLRRLWGTGGVTPRPVQERPPLWMGYQGPKGARRAGLLGECLLTLNKESWPAYRDALAEAGHRLHGRRHPGLGIRGPGRGLAGGRASRRVSGRLVPAAYGAGDGRAGPEAGGPGEAQDARAARVPGPLLLRHARGGRAAGARQGR